MFHNSLRFPAEDFPESSYNVRKNEFNGSLSLIPQVDYMDLKGLTREEKAGIELHVICTHRFASDWTSTLAKFGMASAQDNGTHAHKGRADNSSVLRPGGWLHLTPEEKSYVRNVMFPYDTKVLLAICGREALVD